MDAGEQREAVDATRENRGAGRIVKGGAVVGVVLEEPSRLLYDGV